MPVPAPPELPAGVLALLQQLHGQVAALTARAQEQDDTIAALTAQRTEPPTPVASSTAAAGGPPPQRQPPPERSQQAQQLADLSSQIAAEQQNLAAELHELRQRAADPAAESRQPGPARPTGPDGEEAPPYSYLLMREAHGDGEEDGGDDDAGSDANSDYADGDADDMAWLPASALMVASDGDDCGDGDGDGDGEGDGKCGGGEGGQGGGGGGGGGLAALNLRAAGRLQNAATTRARTPRTNPVPTRVLWLPWFCIPHSTLHTPHSTLHTPHSTPRSTPPGTLPCTPSCTPPCTPPHFLPAQVRRDAAHCLRAARPG